MGSRSRASGEDRRERRECVCVVSPEREPEWPLGDLFVLAAGTTRGGFQNSPPSCILTRRHPTRHKLEKAPG